MAAAQWTRDAEDITESPERWGNYLTVQELAARIGLAVPTIQDTLTRTINDPDDPRSAIVRPAARIGASALNAMPRWTSRQATQYLALREKRDLSPRSNRRRKLPTYTLVEAARAGLAGTREIAEVLGCAENTIRWWARAEPDSFPPEVGIAAREPGAQFGAPRGLRRTSDVQRWIRSKPERMERLAASAQTQSKAG